MINLHCNEWQSVTPDIIIMLWLIYKMFDASASAISLLGKHIIQKEKNSQQMTH
jgi:hypothetical protein